MQFSLLSPTLMMMMMSEKTVRLLGRRRRGRWLLNSFAQVVGFFFFLSTAIIWKKAQKKKTCLRILLADRVLFGDSTRFKTFVGLVPTKVYVSHLRMRISPFGKNTENNNKANGNDRYSSHCHLFMHAAFGYGAVVVPSSLVAWASIIPSIAVSFSLIVPIFCPTHTQTYSIDYYYYYYYWADNLADILALSTE